MVKHISNTSMVSVEALIRASTSIGQIMCQNMTVCGGANGSDMEAEGFMPLPEDIRTEIYKIRLPEFNKGSVYGKTVGYCERFTPELKDSIRRRDDYTCFICKDLQHNTTFHVHHIDYDKKNSSEENLITLCPQCHLQTNKDRGYWEQYFMEGLNLC